MQIYKLAPDQVPRRRSLHAGGLHGCCLGAAPAVNPYPKGIPVAGQGPGGQPFAVDWSPVLSTWVAHSPFGAFPMWTDASFGAIQQAVACQPPFNTMYADYNDGFNTFSDMLGYYDQDNLYGGDICRAPLDFFQNGGVGKSGSLPLLTGGPPCGTGTQTASYALDRATGWYKPVAVQGDNNCPDISMLESFGIFVALAAVVIGGAAALAPAAGTGAAGGAAATGVTAAETGAAVGTVAEGAAPEIAGFTLPTIEAAAPLDLATFPAVDVATVAQTVAAGSTSVLGQVFNVTNYIKQLAGVYSTIKSVAQLTGGAGAHPQAGTVTRLPDGSLQVINPDGSISITQPNGTQATVGIGGQVIPGSGPVPQQAGFGAAGSVLMGLSILGYLLTS